MTRPRKRLLWGLGALAVSAAGLAAALGGDADDDDYVYATVARADLQATVSSTGTLEALRTVDVGTQVSGQVAAVYVDYNDRVEAGQLLAVLDTEALDAELANARAGVTQAQGALAQAQAQERQARAGVAQAQAQLVQTQAQLTDARATRDRNAPLAERGYLSRSEFQPAETAVRTAEATVRAQQAAVQAARDGVAQAQAAVAGARAGVAQAQGLVVQARKNRANAEIRAPIAGLVVERKIDAGQTVAASFETPTLFVLAESLDQMQILASVDESDIGQIREGQAVTFTVPAYPEQTFRGRVREVRLQPTTAQNVVTYTAVLEAANTGGRLLPGMTATVDFVTEERRAVLAVPTAALQLVPTDAMRKAVGDTLSTAGREAAPRLWYQDDAGTLHTVRVRAGLVAGAQTQVEPLARDSPVRPGLRVIEQVLTTNEATAVEDERGGPDG